MPEIMSARELECALSWIEDDDGTGETLIRSRDSAMLEKYKEAICKGCDGYCTKRGRLKCSHMDALDSAFAEIEGGK